MKNSTIRAAICAALVADTALISWCDEQYYRTVTVFDGIDRMQLPQPEDQAASIAGDYPFVAIDVTGKVQGQVVQDEEFTVSAFCALLDSNGYEEVEDDDGNVYKRLPGIELRDEFRSLVLAAIVGASVDGGYVAEVETVNLPVEFAPEFAVDMTITIKRPYAFRENHFE